MVKPRYQREKVQRSKVEHRRHGGKRPLPEPDDEEAQPASLSPASVPTISLERHFPRRRQQQIVLGRGGAGVDHDEYWSAPAPAPALYHVQTHQQQGAYYSTMAYYDVGAGADSSATSSHQRPGHLAAAAVLPRPLDLIGRRLRKLELELELLLLPRLARQWRCKEVLTCMIQSTKTCMYII